MKVPTAPWSRLTNFHALLSLPKGRDGSYTDWLLKLTAPLFSSQQLFVCGNCRFQPSTLPLGPHCLDPVHSAEMQTGFPEIRPGEISMGEIGEIQSGSDKRGAQAAGMTEHSFAQLSPKKPGLTQPGMAEKSLGQVGILKPGPDLVGNVWEWVTEPYAPVAEGHQVLRGGRHGLLRDLAYRQPAEPNDERFTPFTGFRCAAGSVQGE